VTFQSILVILVPEAEPLVSPFRSKHDKSAADGMPAHITINYPFLPTEEDKSGAISGLKNLFSGYLSFSYSLSAIKHFSGVIYLEPSPVQFFIDLIKAVTRQFPQSPPYGGMFTEIISHLTVADVKDEVMLEEIDRQFAIACTGKIPIQARVNEVWLMDNKHGSWTRRISFPLADHL
jgi:hypothetical protein